MRFVSGSFTQFYRAIPVRRTDGIEIVSVSMDGDYAIALGLAQSWSSYLKKHRAAMPAWFHAISAAGHDSAAAFSAFVGSGGTGAGGGHRGARSGAGGGSSGAS
jgi:hypothetical protein